jgi:peroxiredoxin
MARLVTMFLALSIGGAAPEWRGLTWIQGGPLALAGLRGKVVLLRFWTDGCALCRNTAPALRALDEKYRARGLTVVGVHHPKSPASRERAVVEAATRELGFAFPVATDPEWSTVRAYGVGTQFERFTSISILIDRRGRIRFIHPGGEFHASDDPRHSECAQAYHALTAAIERALDAKEQN